MNFHLPTLFQPKMMASVKSVQPTCFYSVNSESSLIRIRDSFRFCFTMFHSGNLTVRNLTYFFVTSLDPSLILPTRGRREWRELGRFSSMTSPLEKNLNKIIKKLRMSLCLAF